MNILIANDDGIQSPALHLLAQVAATLGEVWVVAPAGQCSAMSQRITVFGAITLREEKDFPVAGVHAYSITGTPADCVKVALDQVMPCRPDVVFSGVNQGYNVGLDILYSGTVGVTMEALANGLPAIAWSVADVKDLRVAAQWLPRLARELLSRPRTTDFVWNVNFPSSEPEEIKGVLEDRVPSGKQYYRNCYTPDALPDGSVRLQLSSTLCQQAEPGSDMQAVLDHYISVGRLYNAVLQKVQG